MKKIIPFLILLICETSAFSQLKTFVKNNHVKIEDGQKLIFQSNADNFFKAGVLSNLKAHPRVTLSDNGFDVEIEIENKGNYTSELGVVKIGPFFLSRNVVIKNFDTHDYTSPDFERKFVAKNLPGHESSINGQFYPFSYSPIQVFSDQLYTVGFSVAYPVLEYTDVIYHDLRAFVKNNGAEWYFTIIINKDWFPNKKNTFFYHSPERGGLKTNQKKTFVVSVRLMKNNDSSRNWLSLLKPYKDYFQSKYGPVEYKTSDLPTGYFVPVNFEKSTIDNPYGFINSFQEYKNLRPDLYGWKNWTNAIIGLAKKYKLKKWMLWAPTGAYYRNKQLNFPENFTRHWFEPDTLGGESIYKHKMFDAPKELKRISAAGITFGLYWGLSSTIQPYWDSSFSVIFDIDNKTHRSLKLQQLALARAAGATEIGLDVFPHPLMLSDALRWVDTMKLYYPDIHFISEQGTSDILHSKVGFMYFPQGLRGNRHVLADYLLPGHDTRILTNSDWEKFYSQGFSVFTAKFNDHLSLLQKKNISGLIDERELAIEYSSVYIENNVPVKLSVLNARPGSIRWSTGSTKKTILVNKRGTYSVSAYTKYGFSKTTSIRIQ